MDPGAETPVSFEPTEEQLKAKQKRDAQKEKRRARKEMVHRIRNELNEMSINELRDKMKDVGVPTEIKKFPREVLTVLILHQMTSKVKREAEEGEIEEAPLKKKRRAAKKT
eukprot:TRINITY_DN17319_c0_g1_i1.p1 TRINITY_DN17319_c0_g1~~TRINITY_DN17319_c0_g1_i1.p1  ORF type:complete len:111 (+),score=29.78 TRINITY_DN17319_c0_g1_i1:495-827(+)